MNGIIDFNYFEKVRVKLSTRADNSYNIIIAKNLFPALARSISRDNFGSRYCIITDSNVAKIFGNRLLKQFNGLGIKCDLISFPAGEKSKNLKTAGKILEKMASIGLDRKSCVIALGGGVAGDIAGFAAAIYLRGINFVQVPTTLLAMADSGIGGKTGGNLGAGKNLCGSFHQPKKVYMCTEALSTLQKREMRNGLAEVVKHAVIFDRDFFGFIEQNLERVMSLEDGIIVKLVKRNCELKSKVVEMDEKESNLRKALNFGHTIGHAVEALGNYKKYSHGQAVSIGMACEGQIARGIGIMPERDAGRIRALLQKIGLPVRLEYGAQETLEAARSDKKADGGKLHYALAKSIGRMHTEGGKFAVHVDDGIVKKVLEGCR